MSLVVFAGPSLPETDRLAVGAADWRPPAEAGDLLKLDLRPGLTICLIDGYFDHRPAVRHKEILLALSQGARLIGASSIGALRAAEMASFGMIGVGTIFRAYASGRIVGDDEVALVHGPAEWAWRPLSVPLVEVRATLCLAVRSRWLTANEARRVLEQARAIHYSDRAWTSLPIDLPKEHRVILEREHVALKRNDAKAALAEALAQSAPQSARPQAVSTSFLRALARECRVQLPRAPFPAGP